MDIILTKRLTIYIKIISNFIIKLRENNVNYENINENKQLMNKQLNQYLIYNYNKNNIKNKIYIKGELDVGRVL